MGESSITGPDLIREASEKVGMIRKRLLTAWSRQKSYANIRRRPLEFEAGDHVFLKVRKAVVEVHWTLRGTQEGGRGCISVSVAAKFVERS